VTGSEEGKRRCGRDLNNRWGFPQEHQPITLTVLIATVPDPVHTHLALSFDRMIAAANDNGYVSSYHWFPWKRRGWSVRLNEGANDAESSHDPERERQPGLVILRPGPRGFNQLIYVLLVAESAGRGADGFQLQNALLNETQLKSI
jgi:hypothetical protein